jgi:uncharacterized protein (DUF488 family)
MKSIATIGYEGATVAGFLARLRGDGVKLVVDVRAVASSRRPGFAKTALAANLASVGIEYLHLRALGTPPDGRAAARAGNHGALRRIYLAHLATPVAQEALTALAKLIDEGPRICLLCLEADASHCHRSFIAEALAARSALDVANLVPEDSFADE